MLSTKRMERPAKARLSPVSKPRHINFIFTVNTPILYMYFKVICDTYKIHINLQKCVSYLYITNYIVIFIPDSEDSLSVDSGSSKIRPLVVQLSQTSSSLQ